MRTTSAPPHSALSPSRKRGPGFPLPRERQQIPASVGMTILLAIVFCIGGGSAFGQVTTGIPPFSSFSGGSFDMVNNANLNVHFAIPVVSKAGRGLPFSYSLLHDSSMWTPSSASGSQAWTPDPLWGWHGTEAATGYLHAARELAA